MTRLCTLSITLLLALNVSGCAWYQRQWATADQCATRVCQRYADDNRLELSGGQYDTEAQECACALRDPTDGSHVLALVPFRP